MYVLVQQAAAHIAVVVVVAVVAASRPEINYIDLSSEEFVILVPTFEQQQLQMFPLIEPARVVSTTERCYVNELLSVH